jgi:hypothetical protein
VWSVATLRDEPILLHRDWARVAWYRGRRGREGLCWNARACEGELAVLGFLRSCIDQPFREWTREWHADQAFDVIDLELLKIRGPGCILE